MTKDYEDKKAIKAWEELQEKHDIYVTRQDVFDGLKFYCFDYITNNYFDQPYFDRYLNSVGLESYFDKEIFELIKVFPIYSMEELKSSFDKVIAADYEGLILRDPKGHYKFGRGSIKEGLIYKVKPFETWDAQIIGIVQATEVNPNAEKKINELGRSVTSKKLEDRILIEQAAGFIVKYEGKDLTVPLGGHTAVEKKAVWKNKDSYVGRWIEYKGMEIGMKDVPRIPKFVRYREDKDE
jgi:ATP-dependent DNA ligase